MISVCIMSPAWRRASVTRLALAERRWVCGELAARGIDAMMLIVADDENLDIAAEYGAETLEAPNHPLGEKCNRGFRRAADISDYVVWVGSDNWLHPDVFDPLLADDAPTAPVIVVGNKNATVDLRAATMRRISSPSKYGAIPWIIDSRLLRFRDASQPIQPDLQRGLDGALIRGIRRKRIPFDWRVHNPHDLRCVGFKSGIDITPYGGLTKNLGYGPEEHDPWSVLRGRYPSELVQLAHDTHLALASVPYPTQEDCRMPKLISPIGETVFATRAGTDVLLKRGYSLVEAVGAQPAKPAEAKPKPEESKNAAAWPETHAALDEIADGIDGFSWPNPPEGKKKLTVAEKIAALEAVGAQPAKPAEAN